MPHPTPNEETLAPAPQEGSSSFRDPSKLFFQADYIRRSILASYWIVIIFALPLWWYTTSIERLSLPSSRVFAQAEKDLRFPIKIQLEIPIQVKGGPSSTTQLQELLDERVFREPHKWKGIDIYVRGNRHADSPGGPGTYTITPDKGEVSLQNRHMTFPLGDHTLYELADTLSALLVPYTTIPDQEYRVAQYSPRYRLAFTLLNEDTAAGKSITGWDIAESVTRHLSPILNQLSTLHNFTIESQVQFHAPLAFKPRPVDENNYGLTPEDLTVFVNSAEWSLSSSVSNDHVLHFILFVPSASRRPLHILNIDGAPSSSNAFLLPQWGGIVICNPSPETLSDIQLTSSQLDPVFAAFSNQLLTLLGVPRLPPGVHAAFSHSEIPYTLTDWQLDSLLRRRALENTRGSQDTLRSIVKLVDQIENMPVGQYVKGDVQDALMALDKVYALSSTTLTEALHHSSHALTLASRAFFNPGMLALLYFPAEHKYAVYTPLFASAVIPLIAAALRELWAWKRQRREEGRRGARTEELGDDLQGTRQHTRPKID